MNERVKQGLKAVFNFVTEESLQNTYADLMEDYETWKELQGRYGHINTLIDEINDTNWLLTGDHSHIEQEAW